jgi:glycine cleavage system H protein
MTVLLILATFIVFLTIDYLYSRRRATQPVAAMPEKKSLQLRPGIVAGFKLPENLSYHPGHTWALDEGPNLMRVGLDDFAARLIGKVERIALPQRGRWVRQGQKLMTVYRDGVQAEVVSPMEGMVTAINEAVATDPALALRDPYGDGWLVKLQAPDPKLNLRNLLSGAVARKWMEEAAQRLQARMNLTSGAPSFALAQDGGLAVRDLTAELPDENWAELAREYFLN